MSTEAVNTRMGPGSKPAVLFEVGSEGPPPPVVGGAARVLRPDRRQMRMQMYSLEAMLQKLEELYLDLWRRGNPREIGWRAPKSSRD